jgi:protocatechuate 3,4-dioxygenase alpha subunit
MRSEPTPSQTVGPFFHDALVREDAPSVETDPDPTGPTIVLEGRVLDAEGAGVDDALVELWRADPARADPAGEGLGWARSRTDRGGHYRLTTSPPKPLPHPGGTAQAPHVVLLVFARGLLDQLLTRAYPVDGDAVPRDPVLDRVPDRRRTTLLARRDGDLDGRPRYRFDVRLQGDGETVFFEV